MAAEQIARHLRTQANWCQRLGSPLYAYLLERAAADAESGGPICHILRPHAHTADPNALALRFMGAVHRLVLTGRAPDLARHYPSAGGSVGNMDAAWTDFYATVARECDAICPILERHVQTNEIGRSASLLGGFLSAAESGLPLRLLEVGSSAGLNLLWDLFRYEWNGAAFGPADSPVRFVDIFPNAAPSGVPAVTIAERRGCDVNPIDPASEEGRLTLLCYVWPDQAQRFARLRGALDVAKTTRASIDRAEACEWLSERLATPTPGVATVVFHSIVLQYLGERAARLREIIEEAGQRATARAPLFWLRLEPERQGNESIFSVRMTTWPNGQDRRLAISSPHGPPVDWEG